MPATFDYQAVVRQKVRLLGVFEAALARAELAGGMRNGGVRLRL